MVCLGSGINSSATQNIVTAVNQCHLDGDITVSQNGSASIENLGLKNYDSTPDWILHDSIGYFFLETGLLKLSANNQSGTWKSINSGQSSTILNTDVFKLWFDHGVKPQDDTYAYVVVPNITSSSDMDQYEMKDINIVVNTDSIQAVKHETLNVLQIIFYKAGTFDSDSVKIVVDKPCIMMLKGLGTPIVTVHVADPTQKVDIISADVDLPAIENARRLKCIMPTGVYAGSTVQLIVDVNTPLASIPLSNIKYPTTKDVNAPSIYPNPFVNELTIKYDSEWNKGDLCISDLNGSIIYQTILSENSQMKLRNLHFKKGLYMLMLNNGEKAYCTKIIRRN